MVYKYTYCCRRTPLLYKTYPYPYYPYYYRGTSLIIRTGRGRTARDVLGRARRNASERAAKSPSPRDIQPGEPVRISYGGYPNQRLLLDYGFSLGASNPHGDEEAWDPAEEQ